MKLRSRKRSLRRPLRGRRRRTKNKGLKKVIRSVINKQKETKCMPTFASFPTWKPIQLVGKVVGDDIGEGDGFGQRDGMKIHILGMQVLVNLKQDGAPGASAWVRVLMLQRTNPNTLDGLFRAVDETGDGINYATALPDVAQILAPINKLRYRVKYDRRLRLLPDEAESMGKQYIRRKFYFKINKRITYEQETTDQTKLKPQFVFLIFIQWDDENAEREAVLDLEYYTFFKDV